MAVSMFYITAGGEEEAEKLARNLVENRLAACANIIPAIKSVFFWEGQAQVEEEVIVFGKTRTELVEDLVKGVKDIHSYEVPCIITWEIAEGNQEFLDWVWEETNRRKR